MTSLTVFGGKLFASMGSCTSSHLDAPADFRVREVREGIEDFVFRAALFELYPDDGEITQPGHAGSGHDHRLGPPGNQRYHHFIKDAEHDLGLVLDEAVVLERDVHQRLGHDALGIDLFLLVGRRHEMAVQVVERLVGDDVRRHVHEIALLDGLGLGVAVERLAEQIERGLRRRGGERDEQMIQVVLRDDLGKLFLRVLLRRVGVGLVRLAEWQADESDSWTVVPHPGQRKEPGDNSAKRKPVSSSSDSGRQVKSPLPAATFSISPQAGHSNNSRS